MATLSISRRPFKLLPNPRAGIPESLLLSEDGFRRAHTEITAWEGYSFTPLLDMENIASSADVGCVRIKDECGRFGLGSFKSLGGAYALTQVLAQQLALGIPASAITVTTATDGNHGRSVAWGAQRFGCKCVIYVHENVGQGRVDAIARYGAEVRRVPGTYDDSVREAARAAKLHGWFIISDTSWDGYSTVPIEVMQGYRIMVDEVVEQWQGKPPTHVFVQCGVGALPASVSVHLRTRYESAPLLFVVESDRAACLLASAEAGKPVAIKGKLDTLMAGLACGEPSLLAWQELDQATHTFMAVPDESAVECMNLLSDEGLVAGESAVAGMAAFLLAAADPSARKTIGLNSNSRVLLFNTEGATDPDLYAKLITKTRLI